MKAGRGGVVPPVHSRWQPGKSANPGGTVKGFKPPAEVFKRLSVLDVDELKAYRPKNVLESGIKACYLRAVESDKWEAAHAAIREIVDRIEGKPVQKRVDVTETEIVQRAKALYEIVRRAADYLESQVRQQVEAMRGGDVEAGLTQLLESLQIPEDALIQTICDVFDEGQVGIVLMALEAE